MPTGYTAAIADGITFNAFLMQCARAFGACIMMRGDPMDAPIPDEFKPSDYNERQLAKATERLMELKKMPKAECKKKAKEHYDREVASHQAGIAKDAALKLKYEAMLAEVHRWQPPTADHEGLKKFMRDQINESIKFDCGGTYHQAALAKLTPQTGEGWRLSEMAAALKDIEYHSKAQKEENERTAKRSEWVRKLRESI